MLFKKLLRTMGKYKAQFISMIIMITLGVGVFLGFNMEWYSIKENTDYIFEKSGFADFRLVSEEGFKEEDLERIWGRFYKVDASRNRDDGGSGIGLALVKAIMNNYQSDYGVVNKDDGVEFYFELSQIDHTDEKNEK